ncbi:group II intron maturase-specific domain-containing protein [Wukongibacter sp. M2B1]|uniref:group II intron maturase-specific domain-containing protein n=1 Tax=Wukongibacter sp. M2B1 TaxID=3088895 RepID=UPI003D7A16E1
MKIKLKDLDEWLRRRLRACIWKTWKKVKTKYKNLIKLGILKGKTWEYANTRKGYWRISLSWILTKSITNQRLINYSLKTLSSQYNKFRLS